MSIQSERRVGITREYNLQGSLADNDDHRWLIEKLTVALENIDALEAENERLDRELAKRIDKEAQG